MTKTPVVRGVALVAALALVIYFFGAILQFVGAALQWLLLFAIIGAVIGVPIWLLSRVARGHREEAAAAASAAERAAIVAAEERARKAALPHFVIGTAFGEFRRLGGKQAPERNTWVSMDLASAARGIAALGPPGSGKTSGVMYPMLEQSIKWGHSALVLAIKDEVPAHVLRMAQEFGRADDVLLVSPGPGGLRLNPLGADGGDLPPEAAAAAIADSLDGGNDPYWRDAPAALAQAHLELLSGIGERSIELCEIKQRDTDGSVVILSPKRTVQLAYSFGSLRETISFPPEHLAQLRALGAEVLADIADDPTQTRRAHALEDSLAYFARDYTATFEATDKGAEMLSGLRSALNAPIKALAGDRAIRHTFCGASDVQLEDALNNGKIVIIAVDDTQYPTAFPSILRLIFRCFDAITQRRGTNPNATHCMLWMDEYASFASESHVRTLSRSRSARIIPVLGYQSISFLANEMGSREAAHAIVSVCASIVICGATDAETATAIQARVGEGRWIETRETSVSRSQTNSPGAFLGGFAQGGHMGAFAALARQNDTSTSVTVENEAREENLAAASRLAKLGPGQSGDGTPGVVAIGAIAQSDDGELRDMLMLRQIDYLR